MRVSKRKKLLFIVLITIAIIAGGIWLYGPLIGTRLQARRVDRLLNDFAGNPCDATAYALVDLMRDEEVNADDGTRILKALLETDVKVGQPCIAGEEVRITVSLKHPQPAVGGLLIFLHHYTFSIKDKEVDYFSFNRSDSLEVLGVPTFPRLPVGPDRPAQGADRLVITEPGVYTGLVRLEYNATPSYYLDSGRIQWLLRERSHWTVEWLRQAWARLEDWICRRPPPPGSYSCSFEVPVKIEVVPATQPASGESDR